MSLIAPPRSRAELASPGPVATPARRPPAAFPGTAAPRTHDGPVLAWAGGPDGLRGQVADHAGAVGACLVDGAGERGDAVAMLGSLGALARRAPRRGGPASPLLIAVTDESAPTESDWRLGLRLGVRALVRLPAESPMLLDLLAALVRAPVGALVLGVVGGCGGAGASSLAARLAGACARAGRTTVLVDADPLGGGLGSLVEAPEGGGAGWEDVGRLGAEDGRALRAGLPVIDGVHLLTAHTRPLPDPEAAASAASALAPLDGCVVLDLAASHVTATAAVLDRLILLCPATDHAVRSAARRLETWAVPRARIGLVVRRIGPWHPREVAEDLDVELLGSFRDSSRDLVPLLDIGRRGADRLCQRLVPHLAAAPVRSDPTGDRR